MISTSWRTCILYGNYYVLLSKKKVIELCYSLDGNLLREVDPELRIMKSIESMSIKMM